MRRGWAQTSFKSLCWVRPGSATRFGAATLPCVACLTFVNGAGAQGSNAPAPDASVPVSIWYRSSEGCPDGVAFLSRLEELRRNARLASVGDRVDFVVTLAAEASKSSGRLERQTERGTVAIRDVGASQCTEVAEALALSLDLALEPGSAAPVAGAVKPPPLPEPSPAPTAATPRLVPRAPDVPDAVAPAAADETLGYPPLRLGLHGMITSGLSAGLSGGASVFLEFGGTASEPSVRLSAHGSYGAGTSDNGRLSTTLLAGRIEGCAFGWDGGAWSIGPCLGADAGLLSSTWSPEGGHSDSGPWISGLALVRAAVRIKPHFFPEAQVAGIIPFTRYVMGSPQTRDVFQIEPILLQLSVGARWAL
jgi:hypothetical protein